MSNFIADQIRLPPDKPRVIEAQAKPAAALSTQQVLARFVGLTYEGKVAAKRTMKDLVTSLSSNENHLVFIDDWIEHNWDDKNYTSHERVVMLMDWFASVVLV